jgi:hypothetical protein
MAVTVRATLLQNQLMRPLEASGYPDISEHQLHIIMCGSDTYITHRSVTALLLTFVVRSRCPWGRKGQLWVLLLPNGNNWGAMIATLIWLKLLTLFMGLSVVAYNPWTFMVGWENLLYPRFKTFGVFLQLGYVTQTPPRVCIALILKAWRFQALILMAEKGRVWDYRANKCPYHGTDRLTPGSGLIHYDATSWRKDLHKLKHIQKSNIWFADFIALFQSFASSA